ncbi:MAG TPA: ATP-binding cassette domain-containing protein [Candidatus Lumbricidophila sp.]|nr:ATP-binding cassette domain-containing protein [Candidatus Lumbricidophila sp.]
MSISPSVVLHDVSFIWPDGSAALDRVSGALGRGRTGLIGLNGAGKSTLLRLIVGELAATSGHVSTTGIVDYLPQHLAVGAGRTLADLLGVRSIVDAIRAVSLGSVDVALFDRIGDDWDIEERSVAALADAGLAVTGLDRPASTLSGGERMLAALVGVAVRRADIALLDEPTNNLDSDARARVYDLVRGWRGTLIVVSHDLTLLELMDDTAELRAGGLTVFGGPYSEFRAHVEAEQDAALQALRSAEQTLKRERRQRIEAEERIAHSERQGRKDAVNRKFVPAAINDRRNSAEKSAGARRGMLDEKVASARRAVDAADARVRDDDHISIVLPDPGVPTGRRIARLVGADGREFVLQGPERVALTGPNGVGKTTLLRQLVADELGAGHPMLPIGESFVPHVGYLSQHLDALDPAATVLTNVERVAGGVPTGELRNRLARLLIRGQMIERPVSALSGGERFRAALAQLLLADPPAQLLLLDEPTNSLDLASVDQLVSAVASYRGALLVVSHDRAFLDRLGLTAEFRLAHGGILTKIE